MSGYSEAKSLILEHDKKCAAAFNAAVGDDQRREIAKEFYKSWFRTMVGQGHSDECCDDPEIGSMLDVWRERSESAGLEITPFRVVETAVKTSRNGCYNWEEAFKAHLS